MVLGDGCGRPQWNHEGKVVAYVRRRMLVLSRGTFEIDNWLFGRTSIVSRSNVNEERHYSYVQQQSLTTVLEALYLCTGII